MNVNIVHMQLIGEWKLWTREVESVQRLVLLFREEGRRLCWG